MTEQFEIFEEIEEQTSLAVNLGVKNRRHVRGRFMSVSPSLLRAKVARPAPDSPAAAASPPEAVPDQAEPAPSAPPTSPRVIRTKLELIAFLRERKESLNLSHESIDGLVGWADRYSGKALAPVPRRNLSGDTLQAVLDVLAIGIGAVVLVEDPEQEARMRHRWPTRQPFGPRPSLVRCSDMQCVADVGPTTTEVL